MAGPSLLPTAMPWSRSVPRPPPAFLPAAFTPQSLTHRAGVIPSSQDADAILEGAEREDVAFLVVGDPFGATTHSDLQLRAHQRGVPVRVIHNASVLTAIGSCGLQLYRFGETVRPRRG